jgi:cell wall-associated NlpC family hydrolase
LYYREETMKTLPIRIVLLLIFAIIFFVIPFNNAQASLPAADGSGTAPAQSQAGTAIYTAQSNCVITKVGNPPANQPLPAGCGGNLSVVQLARQHLAGSYIWAAPQPRVWADWDPNKGNAPTHFDCSGFAGWVWYWATNGKVNLPGQTNAVWLNTDGLSNSSVTLTKQVGTKAGLQPGDLVFFGNAASTEHVGIYEGQGACGTNDCFLQWYKTGYPGNSASLASVGNWYVGYVHIVVH